MSGFVAILEQFFAIFLAQSEQAYQVHNLFLFLQVVVVVVVARHVLTGTIVVAHGFTIVAPMLTLEPIARKPADFVPSLPPSGQNHRL